MMAGVMLTKALGEFPPQRRQGKRGWGRRLATALSTLLTNTLVLITFLFTQPAFAQAIPPWNEVQPHIPQDRAAVLYRERPALVELRDRVVQLEAQGRNRHEYGMAKAQCWLRMANESHHENARSPSVNEALDQARELIETMEARREVSAAETPIIGTSRRMREDLWARVGNGKQHPRWQSCAPAQIACLEVQLQWAGHESRETGWRHARPYVEIAEDLTEEMEAKLAACPAPSTPPAAVPAPTPVPAPVPQAPPAFAAKPAPERFTIAADALFRFDRSGPDDVLPQGRTQLDEIAAIIGARQSIERIRITGHADRLGRPDYNQRLAQRRAETVKAHLVGKGVAAAIIETASAGSNQPVTSGCAGTQATRALVECLARDRRVEIEVFGLR